MREKTPPPLNRGKSKAGRTFLIFLGLAFVGMLVAFAAWHAHLRQNTRLQLLRLQKAGIATTIEELEALYPATPEGQKSANAILAAHSLMVTNRHLTKDISLLDARRLPDPSDQNPSDELARMRALTSSNEVFFAALSDAATNQYVRYPIGLADGFSMLIRHLPMLRADMALLMVRAECARIDGHWETALDSLELSCRLRATLDSEPILISYLIQLQMRNRELALCRSLLWSADMDSSQLTRLRDLSDRAIPPGRFLASMSGEVPTVLNTYQCSVPEFLSLDESDRSSAGSPIFRFRVGLGLWVMRTTGHWEIDKTEYLNEMNSVVVWPQEPFPERLERAAEFRERAKRLADAKFILSGMMLPALAKIPTREAVVLAWERITRTAIALEAFRKTHHGQSPPDLDAVVPDTGEEALIDPFTGERLIYHSNGSSWVLYSVGPDRKDDGGKSRPYAKDEDSGFDLVFRFAR